MSANWVNLIAFSAITLIVAGVVAIFFLAAVRRGGRKKPGWAKPSSGYYRQANPKTGQLFP